MLNLNAAIGRELSRLIAEEIQRLTENLTLGAGVPDYSQYKQIVGQITGLRQAIDLCEQAMINLERGLDRG